MRQSALFLLAPMLAACGGSSEPGPGGVSANEAAALDDAAAMVEARRLPDGIASPAATVPNQPNGGADPAK